ncbi:hypothetical protein [Rhodococcus opacus]|nr:hypothetical protein [Rhodococcus opacus]MBV6762627.1 hypothetical protein [Rhodococcus opacus]
MPSPFQDRAVTRIGERRASGEELLPAAHSHQSILSPSAASRSNDSR